MVVCTCFTPQSPYELLALSVFPRRPPFVFWTSEPWRSTDASQSYCSGNGSSAFQCDHRGPPNYRGFKVVIRRQCPIKLSCGQPASGKEAGRDRRRVDSKRHVNPGPRNETATSVQAQKRGEREPKDSTLP